MGAITPNEVAEVSGSHIPEEVISVINDVLVSKIDDNNGKLYANIKQNEFADAIASKMNISRQTVYSNRWLEFEPLFRRAGWQVEYDRPGYNESYEANFTFTATSSKKY